MSSSEDRPDQYAQDSSEDRPDSANPTEQRGGGAPGEHEIQDKGPWAAQAQEGVVPAELGGSDAPAELQDDDPELGSESTGRTAASDEPATESGIDTTAGDNADATTLGGPDPQAAEPDLKDAATGPRQADVEAAE